MESNERATVISNHKSKEYVLVVTNEDVDMCKFINDLHVLHGNRTILNNKVNSLKQAFKNGEYIPPIEVQIPAFEVMEGNHRLVAVQQCIKEGIPFTFRIHLYKSSEKVLDITRTVNNTQKRWTIMDRLISFMSEEHGNGSYSKFYHFLEDNSDVFAKGASSKNYNVSVGLAAIAGNRTVDSIYNTFRIGKLKVTDNHITVANAMLNELRVLTDILQSAGIEDANLFNKYSISVWSDIREKNNWPAFLKKFKKKAMHWQTPASSIKAWKIMFYEFFVPKS